MSEDSGEFIAEVKSEYDIEQIPEAIKEKIALLEHQYPGEVQLFKKGKKIYHQSRNPDAVSYANSFDPSKSMEGAEGYVWFTDKPQERSNIEVTLQNYLIAHDDRPRAQRYEEAQIEPPKDPSNLKVIPYAKLVEAGFEASMEKGTVSMYTTPDSVEIVVFPNGLHSLTGGIQKYQKSSQ